MSSLPGQSSVICSSLGAWSTESSQIGTSHFVPMDGGDDEETFVNAGNSTEEGAMASDPPELPSQDLSASADPKDSDSSLFSGSAEANANDETAVPENVDEPVPVGDEAPPPEGDGVSEDGVVEDHVADESTLIAPEQPSNVTDSSVIDSADGLPSPPEPESEDADDETVDSSPANPGDQEASDDESAVADGLSSPAEPVSEDADETVESSKTSDDEPAVVDDPPSPDDPDQLSNATDVDTVAGEGSSMDEQPSPPEPKGGDDPEVGEKEVKVTASPTASPSAATPPPFRTASPSPAKVYDPLPSQPVNIIVLTDVHSWVMGHGGHEPALDADYGELSRTPATVICISNEPYCRRRAIFLPAIQGFVEWRGRVPSQQRGFHPRHHSGR